MATVVPGDNMPTSPTYVGNSPVEPLGSDSVKLLAIDSAGRANKIPSTIDLAIYMGFSTNPAATVVQDNPGQILKGYPFKLKMHLNRNQCPFNFAKGIYYSIKTQSFDTMLHTDTTVLALNNPTGFFSFTRTAGSYGVTYSFDFSGITPGTIGSTFSIKMDVSGGTPIQPTPATAVFQCNDSLLATAPVSIDQPTVMVWGTGTPLLAGWTITGGIASVTGAVTQAIWIPTILTASPLPPGKVGHAYTWQIVVVISGIPTFTISAGSLPPGLNISPGSGVISGTPTTAGTYTFTVKVTDFAGNFDTKVFSLTINP